MELVFLSYTFDPHPDYAEGIERLQRAARVVIESLELRVRDGVDLGGRAIDAEVERRIGEADALVALVTPGRRGRQSCGISVCRRRVPARCDAR